MIRKHKLGWKLQSRCYTRIAIPCARSVKHRHCFEARLVADQMRSQLVTEFCNFSALQAGEHCVTTSNTPLWATDDRSAPGTRTRTSRGVRVSVLQQVIGVCSHASGTERVPLLTVAAPASNKAAMQRVKHLFSSLAHIQK